MHYSRDDATDFVLLQAPSSYYTRKDEIILVMLTRGHVEFNLSGRSSTWEYTLNYSNVYLTIFLSCTIKYIAYKILRVQRKPFNK